MTTAILFAMCAVAAWMDVRYRRLPNWLNALVALIGLGVAVSVGGPGGLASHALHAGLALIVGALLFHVGAVGGGDAKFYSAVAAWFGVDRALILAVAVALGGLLVVMIWMAARMFAGGPLLARPGKARGNGIPYGVAIAFGGTVCAIWV